MHEVIRLTSHFHLQYEGYVLGETKAAKIKMKHFSS